MRILYFDCFAGASGDMVMGALLDAGVSLEALRSELAKVPITGYRLEATRVSRRGLAATRVEVIDETRISFTPHRMVALIRESGLSPVVASVAATIIERLAAAEAKVHGTPVDAVHFHELASVDTIVDAVGAAAGVALLRADVVHVSPINVGSGMVDSAHGLLPVPAPATLELLHGVPCVSRGTYEATTPTGAAILTTLGTRFGEWPACTVESVGYGAGARDGEFPNVLRVVVGTATMASLEEHLVVLETNIDDMNPELFPHVGEVLLARGAIDVFVTPVLMKKGRPGHLLTVLAAREHLDTLLQTVFDETTTLGIRVQEVRRVRLAREEQVIETPLGPCRVKVAYVGGRVVNIAPEYDDCRRLGQQHNLPVKEVFARVLAAAHDERTSVRRASR